MLIQLAFLHLGPFVDWHHRGLSGFIGGVGIRFLLSLTRMVVMNYILFMHQACEERKIYSILDLKNRILHKMSMKQNGITGVMVLIKQRSKSDKVENRQVFR